MTEDEFDAYMDPTIERAVALTEGVKSVLRDEDKTEALLFAESLVIRELTEAQRVKMLALAITIIAQMEIEEEST